MLWLPALSLSSAHDFCSPDEPSDTWLWEQTSPWCRIQEPWGAEAALQGTPSCCSFALESGLASKSLENWKGDSLLGLAEEVKLLPGHPCNVEGCLWPAWGFGDTEQHLMEYLNPNPCRLSQASHRVWLISLTQPSLFQNPSWFIVLIHLKLTTQFSQ